MPTYMGEEVTQEFLDMMTRVYREQFEAAHPNHELPSDDDVTILTNLETLGVSGGPKACVIARYDADPFVFTAAAREWGQEDLGKEQDDANVSGQSGE